MQRIWLHQTLTGSMPLIPPHSYPSAVQEEPRSWKEVMQLLPRTWWKKHTDGTDASDNYDPLMDVVNMTVVGLDAHLLVTKLNPKVTVVALDSHLPMSTLDPQMAVMASGTMTTPSGMLLTTLILLFMTEQLCKAPDCADELCC